MSREAGLRATIEACERALARLAVHDHPEARRLHAEVEALRARLRAQLADARESGERDDATS